MDRHGNDVLGDWQALAKQSWDAWADFARRAGAPMDSAPAAATPTATWERALDGMKGYFQWLQSAQSLGSPAPGVDWQAQMRRLFEQAGSPLNEAMANLDSAGARSFEDMMEAWTSAYQRPAAAMRDALAIPAFGLTREHQQQQQQLVSAMVDFVDKLNAYQALLARANTEGVDRLEHRLAEMAESGERVESLKALYNLWVNAAEAAYADVAMSEEFRDAYGAVVDALMHVRALQQEQVSAINRQLGVPTRDEVDSLGKRVQELRRQLRRLQHEVSQAKELKALRDEVDALRSQLAGSGSARASTTKVAAKGAASKRTAAAKSATTKAAATKSARRRTPAKSSARKPAGTARKSAAKKR